MGVNPKSERKCPCGAPLLKGKGPRKYCPECQAKNEMEKRRKLRARKARG
jgi:uncharacterized Zn finger protein (UPF0148 family)